MSSNQLPVALVTGGSRGIGRAVVERLARDGYAVSFCYRANRELAEQVRESAAGAGVPVHAARVDVADAAAAKGFVAETERRLGPLAAVVTAAGIVRDRPLAMMSDEEWQEVLRVNLDGTYHVCRAAVFAMMKRRAGVVVTMSSVAGVHGNATQVNYSASKAGIIGFTRALAKEVGRYGIRANAVAPGFIDTDMTAGLPAPMTARLRDRIALGRFGVPEDVADLVSFLVSARAGYITGQVLGVDGGIAI